MFAGCESKNRDGKAKDYTAKQCMEGQERSNALENASTEVLGMACPDVRM